MKLVVGDWPTNQTWRPEELKVDINGVQVLTRKLQGKKLGPGTGNFVVDLDYPPPPVQAPRVLESRQGASTVASTLASMRDRLDRLLPF
jgi:hypothetical protein